MWCTEYQPLLQRRKRSGSNLSGSVHVTASNNWVVLVVDLPCFLARFHIPISVMILLKEARSLVPEGTGV